MARRRSRLRNWSEHLLARSLLAIVGLLPAACLGPLSRCFGLILYAVIKSRRNVVRDNVRLAFGELPGTPDADELCKSSLTSLCRSFMELAMIPRRGEDAVQLVSVRETVEFERVQQAASTGPLVFAASHFGAYEVLGVLAELKGMPITTLVRPLDNPLLESYLNGIRTRFGQKIVGNRGGLRSLARDLEGGRHAVVLVDLNHRASQRIFVDYFGTPAATASTAARLAIRSDRPLVCGFARRLEQPMRFELDFGELHWPRPEGDREEEVVRLMQCVTTDVEERVRREPGLWLWTHRRWKTRPAPNGSADGE